MQALLLLAAWCVTGWAHQMNLSTARITITPERAVVVEVGIKGSDLDRALGTRLSSERDGTVRPQALAGARAAIAAYVSARTLVLGAGGTRCRAGASTMSPDGDGVAVRTRWACAEIAGRIHYRSTLLTDIAPNPREVVVMRSGDVVAQDLLDATRRDIALIAAPKLAIPAIVERYLAAGAEHGFMGYAHLAFLAGLVLWARRTRPVVKVVAAFAVAHSITLWLAGLGLLRFPGTVVQSAIAASVVYIAIANFFSREIERRWREAFAFGLLHGLGYAASLQAFGLPLEGRLPALAAFNVGVDIALIEICVLLVPLLRGLDRVFAFVGPHCAGDPILSFAASVPTQVAGRTAASARPAFAVYAMSAVIAALGVYWLLSRTVLQA